MIIDMRKRVIPPGYAGHVPCRTEAFGMPEGKALQLSVATYELFQAVKKKPPLGKRDIKRFTGDVHSMTNTGDLTKGGNVGSGSVLVHSPDEWKEE